MTDPIDLLDEASWLHHYPADGALLEYWVARPRTVGDLRRLLALARDAARLRAALAEIDRVASEIHDDIYAAEFDETHQKLASDGIWRIHQIARPLCAASPPPAALEGTDR
jgi:hypothetical protein